MKAQIENLSNEIESIVLFAKRINYDMNKGIDELANLWINDCQKTWAILEDNKEETKRIIKSQL
jgi:predicted phage-related endonuclease